MFVPEDYPDRRVAIVGCGYVGLTLAAMMADCGFDVLGVEIRQDVLNGLRKGVPHFHEPGLEATLHRLIKAGRLTFTRELPAQSDRRVYIITVGTPLNEEGRARFDMIEHATREVAQRIKPGDLVIMRSTVKLGTTRALVMPLLAKTGVPYDIAFCPERTIEGHALSELRTLPQIVGGDTMQATVRASQLFQLLTPTTVRVSTIETAEMIKLVDNAQRDVFFGFSNEIARLCDASAINAAEVIRAGKLGYPRTNLPLPGPVGGPCLSKDPYILAESFEGTAIQADIVMAARRTNERQPEEIAQAAKAIVSAFPGFPSSPVVTIMGLAFKGRPETDDLRGTMARPILNAFRSAFPNGQFRGWDPVVAEHEIARFGLEVAGSIEGAFSGAHVVVLANNHPAFAAMPIELLAERMSAPALIYDLWNNHEIGKLNLPRGRHYVTLGGAGLFRKALA